MHHFEIRPNRFLVWWLVGSVLVYPLAIIIGAVTVFVIGAAVSVLTSLFRMPLYRLETTMPVLSLVYGGVVIAALSGAIGFSVGHIQRYLLRRYLYWTADYWRVLSTVGGMLGGLAVAGVFLILPYNTSQNKMWLMPLMPLFILIVSLFQWRSLRTATRHASLWAAANVLGGMVWSGVIFMNEPDPYSRTYGLTMLMLGALAVAAQGFITGFIVLWLFEKYAYPPVDTDGDGIPDKGRKPSVWDNAI